MQPVLYIGEQVLGVAKNLYKYVESRNRGAWKIFALRRNQISYATDTAKLQINKHHLTKGLQPGTLVLIKELQRSRVQVAS